MNVPHSKFAWEIEHYHLGMQDEWDQLVDSSLNGNLLQTRRFLDYHGDRFSDCSLAFRGNNRVLEAVLPLADLGGGRCASHPGSTYGGLIVQPYIGAEKKVQLFRQLFEHLTELGFTNMLYTPVPSLFHSVADESDLYALASLGGVIERRQPNFVLDPEKTVLGRKKNRALARKAGVAAAVSTRPTEVFKVVRQQLLERHGLEPVHTEPEFKDLQNRLGKQLIVVEAAKGATLLAGAILLDLGSAIHVQYMGNNSVGREVQALDAVVEFIYDKASTESKLISFGISTDQSGEELNTGLAAFKENFGSHVRMIDRYFVPLQAL